MGQSKKNVVIAQAQTVVPPQLGVELPRDFVVGMKERLPRPQLDIGESLGHPERLARGHLLASASGIYFA